MPAQIKKRDGSIVAFDAGKIFTAIQKAAQAVGGMTDADVQAVTDDVVAGIGDEPTVEGVQDAVELTLMRRGFPAVAKAYILYRSEHARIRDTHDFLMQTYKRLTYADATDIDLKRENANINGDSAMGTMLKYGSEGSNFFVNNHILPKDIADGHISGDFHIHDKDFYMLTETCCQIDLLKLYEGGFHTGHGFLREPNSIGSAAALACIAIQANQNEMHGGQSVPHFDYCMAPYVNKTFKKEYRDAFSEYMSLKYRHTIWDYPSYDGLLEKIVNEITVDNRSSIDIDRREYAICLEKGSEVRRAHEYAQARAFERTNAACHQAMEALIHNLNTMASRAGAQVPFSSLNYGTDTSTAGRMVIRNLLLATQEGLGDGETPIFPVQIFKVKDGVSYNPGDPNYDLFELAIATSAKRLFPNFTFLDAPFNRAFYTQPGDWDNEVGTMGCRTRVMANVYDPSREVTCGRGNLSFTTINLPRIGIEAHGDWDRFFEILDDRMDIVFRQLKHRLKIQGKRKVRNYPFLMGNGIWLDSEKLGWDDEIGEILKHGTLTVGFIGLAECLVAMTGAHHAESEDAQEYGLRVIKYMRGRCDEAARTERLNYSLLGTPAEGLAGRFVPLDRARYGVIQGVTDKDYYTNSFHVPVNYPIKAFRKIQIEAPYHALTNGGHITYVELDGDTSKNLQAFEKIVRYMHDQGVGYGSINHPIDRDPVCGYTGVINGVCPRCGRREGEAIPKAKLEEIRRKFGRR